MTGVLCAQESLSRDEPVFATASTVKRWLLVERPGRWGAEAVPLGRLDPHEIDPASAYMQAVGARLLLIRRPPSSVQEEGRRAFLVESVAGRERVRTLHVADEEAVKDIVLSGGPGRGGTPDWQPYEGRLLLVCTHGRHDACCSISGRPVAQALAEHEPERTWECTHVGGDRFAANVVVLPEGLFLGRMTPARVPDLLASLAAREVPPEDLVRGRSGLSLPAQAAQHFARVELGLRGLDDLVPVHEQAAGPGAWRVVLSTSQREVAVTVTRTVDPQAHLLTCGATQDRHASSFALTELVAI